MKINFKALFRPFENDFNADPRARRLWKIVAVLLGIGLFFLLWSVLAYATGEKIVPSIGETFISLIQALKKGPTYIAVGMTFFRVLTALSASFITALVLGSLAGYYPFLEYVFRPTVTVLRSFPSVALILILIIYTKAASFFLVALVLFPIIYEAVLNGSKQVKNAYRDVLALDSGTKPMNIVRVIIPLSFDYIAVGVLQSIGLGLKVQIMGETFMGSTRYVGLGRDIYLAYLDVNMARIFALSLLAIAVVFAFDLLAVSLKRRINDKLITQNKRI